MRCPSFLDIVEATLALLPRGRAWQTNQGRPRAGREIAFNPDAFNNDAFSTSFEAKSVIRQYWEAFAAVMKDVTDRLCALRLEFWCATMNETKPEWLVEYGLPDLCEPFPDICTKVSAIGGTRCEYYAMLAARIGWSIECVEQVEFCGSLAGKARAGCARAGAVGGSARVKIIVHTDLSPAYVRPSTRIARAGRFRAGQHHACGVNSLLPLQCLLSRVIHAEIFTVYEARTA